MGDKYINDVGLQAIKQWIIANFTNIIEQVKVNGQALTPDANKAVDISAAELETNESLDQVTITGDGEIQFTNSLNGMTIKKTYPSENYESVELASKSYVDSNGGKIDKIKVNGVEQTITNKEVDLNVPQYDEGTNTFSAYGNNAEFSLRPSTNGMTGAWAEGSTVVTKEMVDKTYTDSTFRTQTQVQEQIDEALADVTGIDFQVVDTLPATGTKGVIYLLLNTGTSPNTYDEYIWVEPTGGTPRYEKIGTTDVDLSNYWTMTEGHANTLVAMTVAEINAILNA